MDLLPTKGIEYLLMIGYLILLVPLAWLLIRMLSTPASRVNAQTVPAPTDAWFRLPEGVYWHRGHTWAAPVDDQLLRIGIDDFARRLLGPPSSLSLPEPGQYLEQGECGWSRSVNGHAVDLLSPVQGEVVEVNNAVMQTPSVVCDDPYDRGWLLKVRVDNVATALKNLLPRKSARVWMNEARAELETLMHGELGPVLQDGGAPVSGFAVELAGDRSPLFPYRR